MKLGQRDQLDLPVCEVNEDLKVGRGQQDQLVLEDQLVNKVYVEKRARKDNLDDPVRNV